MKRIKIQELDDVFSLYIRTRALIDEAGHAECISCGKIDLWYKMDCGHYYSRGENDALRYNEANCYIQCKTCNIIKKGNYPHYTYKLLTMNGTERGVALLTRLHIIASKGAKKYTEKELDTLIALYYSKIPAGYYNKALQIKDRYLRKYEAEIRRWGRQKNRALR